MTPEEYQERKQAKIERFENLAEKKKNNSDALYNEAKKMSDCIPFGQPILVGHHSEGRDRNFRNRIHNKFGKSFEEQGKAEYYENKVKSLKSNNSISSDDPEAVLKLREKIERLKANQELMKKVNTEYKKTNDLNQTSLDTESIKSILRTWEIMPYLKGKPFQGYSLTNNNANINRLKKRLVLLEKKNNEETTEKEINGIRIVENTDENRLQIFFPDIPSPEIRKELKRNGFRWSRFNGCWQRHRSNVATWKAENIVNSINN